MAFSGWLHLIFKIKLNEIISMNCTHKKHAHRTWSSIRLLQLLLSFTGGPISKTSKNPEFLNSLINASCSRTGGNAKNKQN